MTASAVPEPRLFATTDPLAGEPVRLAASRCDVCERLAFPARNVCDVCGGDVTPATLPNRASLAGWTLVLHPAPGAKLQPPYHVAIAEFPGGLSILGLLVEVESEPLLDIEIETVGIPLNDGSITFGFRPIGARVA